MILGVNMKKICLICSSGGHLTELKQIIPAVLGQEYFFITMKKEDTLNMKNTYFMIDASRNPITIVLSFFHSFYYFLKLRPDIIITTGAGFAVPFCYIGKLFGKKIIYVESICRINSKSLAGRLIYPIADHFLVQWRRSLKFWGKKAQYHGGII